MSLSTSTLSNEGTRRWQQLVSIFRKITGMSLLDWLTLLLGEPLATAALEHQAIRKLIALPVFASDALSSVAYASQEILLVLVAAGTAAFTLSIPISIGIVALLFILMVSYRQTIHAYPGGGGAYIVAKDNLGELASVIAAVALLIDYVLTVAVSITAGVEQVTSTITVLQGWNVTLSLLALLAITVINLKGVKESGVVFAVPTYLFVAMTFLMILCGFLRWITGTLDSVSGVEMVKSDMQQIGTFLLLRAFSSGCTALTGVEAISNGIPAFAEPKPKNAAATMVWLCVILAAMFMGITGLALMVHAVPSETKTVINQIQAIVFSGWMYPLYLISAASTTLILVMAANTSYADFPRLAALVAEDSFLPRQLAWKGHRLVYSRGIILLAMLSAALIVAFGGKTDRLIALYAVGVFLGFSLSQSGMVRRWLKIGKISKGEVQANPNGEPLTYDRWWWAKLIVNAVGCALTTAIMFIIGMTKFVAGAWFIIILIPALAVVLYVFHKHYKATATCISVSEGPARKQYIGIAKTILLVEGFHQGTEAMIRFAQALGKPWLPVHIAVDDKKAACVVRKWYRNIDRYSSLDFLGEPLFVVSSPYRWLDLPLRQFVLEMRRQNPDEMIHIVLGAIIATGWLHKLLHQGAHMVLWVTLARIPGVVVTIVPVLTNGALKAAVALEEEIAAAQQAAAEPEVEPEA